MTTNFTYPTSPPTHLDRFHPEATVNDFREYEIGIFLQISAATCLLPSLSLKKSCVHVTLLDPALASFLRLAPEPIEECWGPRALASATQEIWRLNALELADI